MKTNNAQIKMWWYADEINFGDQLNPYLVKKMTGRTPCFTPPKDPPLKYLVIGSILQGDMSRCIIWGSGLINLNITCTRPYEIHAVRGPLTRALLLERGIPCPEIYGDPALLLPYFFQPIIKKQFKIGIIPHYVDQEHPWLKQFSQDSNVLIIDVRQPVERVIRDMLSCECIASSSLHGIIVADAYELPTCWLEFSDKVLGKGFKFKDYFLSLEIEPSKPLQIENNTQLSDVLKRMRQYSAKGPCQPLLKACPFYSAQETTSYTPNLTQSQHKSYFQNYSYEKDDRKINAYISHNNSPLVSIIIPTVNRQEQLIDAVLSIEKQTYKNVEIVLVNDGGIDLSFLSEKLPKTLNKKIIFVNLQKNFGRSYARNKGIKASSGELLGYLDDDDILYSDHVERLVQSMKKIKANVAYTDANRAFKKSKNGKLITYKIDRPFSEEFNRNRFLLENYIPINCLMHSRKCIENVGGFDSNLMRTEDWDLWLRMSQEYDFIHIPKVTCEYTWEEERQPSSEKGGWEPYSFAALHMYHKYKKFITQNEKIQKIHLNKIDDAVKNLSEALLLALKCNNKSFNAIFGTNNINYIKNSFQTLPALYPERQKQLVLLHKLFTNYVNIILDR